MANRFQELFRLLPKLYSAGAPVMIEAGALQKDSATNRVLAQLKLRSLDPRRICACKVSVRAFEPNGTGLDGVPSFAYLDIDVGSGENFGTKTPIYLPDGNSRSMSVSVIETVFSDGSVWQAEPCEWHQIPVQEAVVEHFDDPELIKQYELRVGGDCPLIPTVQDGLFLCTCGTANLAGARECYNCRRKYADLEAALDLSTLIKEKDERLQRETEAREAAERAAAEKAESDRIAAEIRRKKVRKAAAITVPILIVIAVIIALMPGGIKPAIDNLSAYNDAKKLLADGSYDEAKLAFSELGDFLKAEEMVLESDYQKADSLCAKGEYEQAIDVWNSISEYSDSTERSAAAEEAWHEPDYQAALAMMEDEDFIAASELFASLGGYKDADDKSVECIELKKAEDYDKASADLKNGNYKEAESIFKFLDDYKDAAAQRKAAAYAYAVQLAEAEDYSTAIPYFTAAGNYEDAKEHLTDAIYNYACQELSAGRFSHAKNGFMRCAGYKDADDKYNEADYGYGCQLLDDKEYDKAVSVFEELGSYKDSASKQLEAKYGYVVDNKRLKETSKYYGYINDLVDARYKDSRAIYKEVYKWTVTVSAINSSATAWLDEKSIGSSSPLYAHYKVSGGPPNGKTEVIVRYTFPSGYWGDYSLGDMRSGSSGCVFWEDGIGGPTGTLYLKFYDSDRNQIGSASIKITN